MGHATEVAVGKQMKWTTGLFKSYRTGLSPWFSEGRQTVPIGVSPFFKIRVGAQVAPQRCPILRRGKSTQIIQRISNFEKEKRIIEFSCWGTI